MRVRLRTATFFGYARLRTAGCKGDARLRTVDHQCIPELVGKVVPVEFMLKGTMCCKRPPGQFRANQKKGCHPTRPSTSHYKSFSVSTIKCRCPGRLFICTISSGVKSFKDCGVAHPSRCKWLANLRVVVAACNITGVAAAAMSHIVIAVETYPPGAACLPLHSGALDGACCF